MRNSPSTLIEITGQTFGWWTVIERVPNRWGKVHYRCRCRCGIEKEVGAQQLRQGKSKSCGCYGMRRTPAPRPDIHGKAWSEEEKTKLRIYYGINGNRGVRKLINRTPQAINTMAKKLGIRVGHHICPRRDLWSERELERLKLLYPQGGIRACRGKFPFRTDTSIKWKANEIGLKVEGNNRGLGKSVPRDSINDGNASLAA
jgi:hypothetical protein